MILDWRLLSFKYYNFGINAIFAVFTHEDVALIASNAKATAWRVKALNLVAPVGGVVIKQFHFVAVDLIFHIDIRA